MTDEWIPALRTTLAVANAMTACAYWTIALALMIWHRQNHIIELSLQKKSIKRMHRDLGLTLVVAGIRYTFAVLGFYAHTFWAMTLISIVHAVVAWMAALSTINCKIESLRGK